MDHALRSPTLYHALKMNAVGIASFFKKYPHQSTSLILTAGWVNGFMEVIKEVSKCTDSLFHLGTGRLVLTSIIYLL